MSIVCTYHRLLCTDQRAWRSSAWTPDCGGSWQRSSPAARWPGHHSRNDEVLHLGPLAATCREVVNTSREGGASLNILSGLTAGNFCAFWIGGVTIGGLMAIAYIVSHRIGLDHIMLAEAVFAFGLVAFGFLGMGPVTIAVDSYGPVTDNAQAVYELSLIEQHSQRRAGTRSSDFGIRAGFRARQDDCWKKTTGPATHSRPPPSRC